jgi:hypothetical protein
MEMSRPGTTRRHFLGASAGAIIGGGVVALGGSSALPRPALAQPQELAVGDLEPNPIKRRGLGRRAYDPQRASPGFTLFTPQFGDGTVYLVDLEGTVVHTWKLPYPPGRYGYLTDRGTLFYNGRTPGPGWLGRQGFKGGVVLEADWNGNVLWEVQQPDHRQDGRLLRNGNALLLCAGVVPQDIAARVRGGIPGTEDDGTMYADYVVEMTPDGQTVWEWRSWEHLDPEADGHTAPGDVRNDWTGGNAVMETPEGDILVSMRQNSTVVRIDRQTGEVTWKLSPPTVAGQHAPTPLPNGNILLLDNGPYRPDQSVVGGTPFPFSRVIEVDPATNEIAWEYREAVPQFFFSPGQGNAQRLPNGNTLVDEAFFGRLFEVTPGGDLVWEYVNPYFGPANAPARAQQNQVFRAYRYAAEEIDRARGTHA